MSGTYKTNPLRLAHSCSATRLHGGTTRYCSPYLSSIAIRSQYLRINSDKFSAVMPSYFRRLFGDSSNHDHTPRPSSSKADRSRHTHFAEVPPQGAQYARSEARYGHSARSNPPSPFGPPIDVNVRTAHRHGKTPAPVPSTSELRPQVLRRASHNKTPGSGSFDTLPH